MADTAQLQVILNETLSPERERRQKAEDDLRQAQVLAGHSLRILSLVREDSTPPAIRQAAAIHFKNLVKNSWDDETKTALANDKPTIRSHVLDFMCTVPPHMQKLLSEAISCIAAIDYPDHWQNLLPEIVARLQAQPAIEIQLGLLRTAHSIFKCFRFVQRSDALYTKLKYTLENFQEPLLRLYHSTGQDVARYANDVNALRPRMEALRIMTRIVFSLNYQDLPEFFEDNMGTWMKEYAKYLEYENPLLVDPDEEDEPSVVDQLQAGIIQVLDLYSGKDEEPFVPFLPKFTRMIWNLLMKVTANPKHDALATQAILFLKCLVAKEFHRGLFESPETLQQIVESIVLPNLLFREADQILFEDNPQEYMLIETQGDSKETSRRRCAQDLLQAMCSQFPEQTVGIVSRHVETLLQGYAAAPDAQWAQKDAAIHLMMGIAVKRENSYGVSETNAAVNVIDFFQTQIFPELQETTGRRPVLQTTALKFICTFRFQFDQGQLAALLSPVMAHLSSTLVVVHTYACYTLERMLVTPVAMTLPDLKKHKLKNTDLSPVLEPLFNGLFAIVENIGLGENEYAMKCVTRTLATAAKDVTPVHEFVIQKLTAVLGVVAKNPRQPHFNHYLFESIALLVRSVCSQDPSSVARTMEPLLFPPFTAILSQEVLEFQPYVFQVLAQLLEYRTGGVGEAYTNLFTPIISPSLWNDAGNVPALARLLKAYILKATESILPHLQAILGIYQKLMSVPVSEEHGYSVMRSILIYVPFENLEQHMSTIFGIMLSPLQVRQTDRRLRLITNFFALFVGRMGPQLFFNCMDRVQPGLGTTMVSTIWTRRLTTIPASTAIEAKEQVIAGTRLLCESPVLEGNQTLWLQVFVGIASMLTSPLLSSVHDTFETSTTMVYDSTYSRLTFAFRPEDDYFASSTNPSQSFCTAVQSFWSTHPWLPQVQAAVASADPKLATGLQQVFQQAGVQL